MMAPVNADIDSPRKQFKQGIPAQEVICKQGLDLIIRNNGEPACVKTATAETLQKRGLAFVPVKITDLKQETKPAIPKQPIEFKDAQNEIQNIPATRGSIVNFYITDDDLNIAHTGVEVISTEGFSRPASPTMATINRASRPRAYTAYS